MRQATVESPQPSDTDPRDYVVSKPLARRESDPNLRTGAEFRESLRDGRHVIVNGTYDFSSSQHRHAAEKLCV